MADNDRFPHLKPRWNLPYKQICEWQLPSEIVARTTLLKLKKTLQYYKNPPIMLLDNASDYLMDHSVYGMDEYLAYVERNRQTLTLRYGSPRKGLDYAMRESVRYGSTYLTHPYNAEHFPHLARAYVQSVYTSDFETIIRHYDQHYNDASVEEVHRRLGIIRPHVLSGIEHFVTKIVKFKDVDKLNMPPKNPQTIDLHANLN